MTSSDAQSTADGIGIELEGGSGMPRLRTPFLILCGSLATIGCAGTSVPPRIGYGVLPTDEKLAMVSAGDYSLVTVREREVHVDGADRIMCVSPSPDWASALTASRALSASGSAPSGPTGSLSLNASNAEALSLMAGRSAGVVALRDGLYQACLAYANGQIGRTAYAVILSQYGNLLTSVIEAGGGGTGAASSSGGSSAPAPAVAVSVAGNPAVTGTGGTPAGGKGGGDASATHYSERIAVMQQEHIQALVVACLNQFDPSMPRVGEDRDMVLGGAICQRLIGSIVEKVPGQLTPQDSVVPSPGPTPTRKTPKKITPKAVKPKPHARAGTMPRRGAPKKKGA